MTEDDEWAVTPLRTASVADLMNELMNRSVYCGIVAYVPEHQQDPEKMVGQVCYKVEGGNPPHPLIHALSLMAEKIHYEYEVEDDED